MPVKDVVADYGLYCCGNGDQECAKCCLRATLPPQLEQYSHPIRYVCGDRGPVVPAFIVFGLNEGLLAAFREMNSMARGVYQDA